MIRGRDEKAIRAIIRFNYMLIKARVLHLIPTVNEYSLPCIVFIFAVLFHNIKKLSLILVGPWICAGLLVVVGSLAFYSHLRKSLSTLAKYNQNTHRFLTIEKGRKSEPIVLSLKQFSRAKNVVRVRAERIPANQKRLIYSLSMMVNLYSLYRTWCSPNRQLQSRAVFCSLEIKCSIESPWGQHWRSGNDHWR